jgi:hypothetical protein
VFGVKPVKSTTYHAQSQGLVEKFNGTLKTMLASYTNEKQNDWSDYVNLCVFAYNTAVQKSTKISPHEAMFGKPARTSFSSLFEHQSDVKSPVEYAIKIKKRLAEIHETVKINQDLADEASKDYYDRKSTNVEFPVGARVWLNDPAHKVGLNEKMRPKVTGPWIVKKKCNVNYEIETEQGEPTKTQTVHRNRLRTCHSPPIRVDAPPSPQSTNMLTLASSILPGTKMVSPRCSDVLAVVLYFRSRGDLTSFLRSLLSVELSRDLELDFPRDLWLSAEGERLYLS